MLLKQVKHENGATSEPRKKPAGMPSLELDQSGGAANMKV